MARYFFHVHDGDDIPDLQGCELPDMAAARREALRYAGALLGDHAEKFWGSGEWKMRVTDERDLTLFELLFVSVEGASAG